MNWKFYVNMKLCALKQTPSKLNIITELTEIFPFSYQVTSISSTLLACLTFISEQMLDIWWSEAPKILHNYFPLDIGRVQECRSPIGIIPFKYILYFDSFPITHI